MKCIPTECLPEIEISEYEKNLKILRDVEFSIIDRMQRFPDQIFELNDQLIKAKGRTLAYERGGGGLVECKVYEGISMDEYLPPLMKGDGIENLPEDVLKMAGIYNLDGGLFTNSLVVVAANIDSLFDKIQSTKGIAKIGFVEKWRKLTKIYNDAVGFESYDFKYFER